MTAFPSNKTIWSWSRTIVCRWMVHFLPYTIFILSPPFVCILSTLHEYTTLRMTIYHMELASQNLTTHEDIAEVFMVRKSDKSKEFYLDNPYDLGSWTKNLTQLFFGRRTKSLVDTRTFVDPFTPMENKPKYPKICHFSRKNGKNPEINRRFL